MRWVDGSKRSGGCQDLKSFRGVSVVVTKRGLPKWTFRAIFKMSSKERLPMKLYTIKFEGQTIKSYDLSDIYKSDYVGDLCHEAFVATWPLLRNEAERENRTEKVKKRECGPMSEFGFYKISRGQDAIVVHLYFINGSEVVFSVQYLPDHPYIAQRETLLSALKVADKVYRTEMNEIISLSMHKVMKHFPSAHSFFDIMTEPN